MDKIRSFLIRKGSLTAWLVGGLVMFVLLVSTAMILYFHHLGRVEEKVALQALGRANALFLDQSNLPQSQHMAKQLGRVMGAEVAFFEKNQSGLGEADGRALRIGQQIHVGYRLVSGKEAWFSKEMKNSGAYAVWKRTDARIGLGGFWLIALLFALWLGRKVTQPMSKLAAVLPKVGSDESLDGLPSSGPLEIRELAASLKQTHESLRSEREKRRHAERLALLGQMAASLAHEVRNPVSAIQLHAQLMERACQAPEKSSATTIIAEARRIDNLVTQWMQFAKPGGIRKETFDLKILFEDLKAALQPQAEHSGASIVIDPQGNESFVKGDRERLRQVFWNILLNAIQSMPGGGKITVKLSSHEVSIKDEGTGFSDTALEHFGEPFHSQREGGMGLGLAVSKEIIQAHGGVLTAANRQPKGASVTVRFNPSC